MLKAAGGGSEREVLFRLKAVPDKDNPRAFKGMADNALKAQRAIDQGATKSANHQTAEARRAQREAEKAARDKERAIERGIKKEMEWEAKAAKAAEKAARDKQRAVEKAIKEQERTEERARKATERAEQQRQKAVEKAIKDETRAREKAAAERKRIFESEAKEAIAAGNRATREHQKAINEQLRATRQAAQEESRAAAKALQDRNRAIEGTRQLIEGTTKLGRAFALSGAIGEKEMQKVLDTLIKVQLASDVVRGGLDIAQGLGKTRIGRGISTAASTAIGAVGGGLLATGAGKIAGAAAGAAQAAGPAALIVAAGAIAAGVIRRFGAGIYQTAGETLGFDPVGNKAVAKRRKRAISRLEGMLAQEQAGAEIVERQSAELTAIGQAEDDRLQLRYFDDPRKLNRARQRSAFAEAIAGGTQAATATTDTERTAGVTRQVEAYRQMLQLKREEAGIVRDMNERSMATNQNTIESYRQQIELGRQRRRELTDQRRSTLVQAATADPLSRSRAADVLEKLEKGQQITAQEAEFARPFANGRTTKRLDEAVIKSDAERNPSDRLRPFIERQFQDELRRVRDQEKDSREAIRGLMEQNTELKKDTQKLIDEQAKASKAMHGLILDGIKRSESLIADIRATTERLAAMRDAAGQN